jgi:hypothetical protein
MAFRPRTPRPNLLDLSIVLLDRLVQLLVVAVLDQVGQDPNWPALGWLSTAARAVARIQ